MEILNETLIRITRYFCPLNLKISINKTKACFFHNKYSIDLDDIKRTGNIKVGDENIEIINSFKYLGVYLDYRLNWKLHINNIN